MLNVRGASVFWYEGSNVRAVVALVAALLVGWIVSRWRHSVADRTGRPARSGLFAIVAGVVVVAVLWLVLGLGGTAPELDGRRVIGGNEFFVRLRYWLPIGGTPMRIACGSTTYHRRWNGDSATASAASL